MISTTYKKSAVTYGTQIFPCFAAILTNSNLNKFFSYPFPAYLRITRYTSRNCLPAAGGIWARRVSCSFVVKPIVGRHTSLSPGPHDGENRIDRHDRNPRLREREVSELSDEPCSVTIRNTSSTHSSQSDIQADKTQLTST